MLALIDRYKVPFYHQQLEDKWGCLESKYGRKAEKIHSGKVEKAKTVNEYQTNEY